MPRIVTEEEREQHELAVYMARRWAMEQYGPKYDWYADSCPCNLPPGECKLHPRARPNEVRVLPDGAEATFGQRPPEGDWQVWMFAGGRGAGKSRTGAEFVRHAVEKLGIMHVALVSETAADIRDVMVEGPAGLLNIAPPWFQPTYEPSKRRVLWPNGAIATCFSSERPEQLRGPQYQLAWADELAKWVRTEETWNNLEYVTRMPSEAFGDTPRFVVTTTPRATATYKMVMNDPNTVITRGSSLENERHVAASWIRRILRKFEGTRIGRQEIWAELVEDTAGALWNQAMIDSNRVDSPPCPLARIVVGIDPSVGSNDPESGAEAGIVVGGLGTDRHVYILEDRSLKGTPEEWAEAAVAAYNFWRADRVVAEVNNGGDMVGVVLRTVDPSIAFKKLWASRGKLSRNEPVAAIDERGEAHHVNYFPELEAQMCSWVPGLPSPDRLDARTWVVTELAIDGGADTEFEDDPYHGERI